MSDKFTLSEGSIIINEGNIIWSDAENNSIQYVIDENSLVDSSLGEGYITAIDDSESQYFSVLEMSNENDVTLEDVHNLTLENPKSALFDNLVVTESEVTQETEDDSTSKQNVVLFKVNNELYGVQVAEDDHGNLQKYKFKFRTSDDGQLEIIPESVELVTSDEISLINPEVITKNVEGFKGVETEVDPILSENEDVSSDQMQDQESMENVYIKGETSEDEEIQTENTLEEIEIELERGVGKGAMDIKEEILQELRANTYQYPRSAQNPQILEVMAYNPMSEESQSSEASQVNEIVDKNQENHIIYDVSEKTNEITCEEEEEDSTFIGEENVYVEEDTYVNENVEGTGDNLNVNAYDPSFQDIEESTIQETVVQENIDQHDESLDNMVDTEADEFVEEIYIDESSVPPPDLETAKKVESNSQAPLKPSNRNPRSILKSSFVNTSPKGLRSVKRVRTSASCIFPTTDERYQDKRFARNKDVQETRKFHHFLNRTTIPQAPVRKKRLPRKQKITTGTREDDEIIVQEVLVSASGIIGPLHERLVPAESKVTAVVEISDSEEDTNQNKKRRTNRSESRSESEASVIEIYSIDENIENKPLEDKKRSRGRPRKSEVKGRPPSIVPELLKKEIRCPYCPKTFPSQNSLNTHIHHHNLENSLRRAQNMLPKAGTMVRQSLLPSVEYNHKCENCDQTFKNSLLLQRHVCSKKNNMYNCSVCSKKFADVSLFNIHKKSHVKSNLVKNTNSEKISPKKIKNLGNTSVFKSPRKSIFKSTRKSVLSNINKKQEYKCGECQKPCFSDINLKIHEKTHKKFACTSCGVTFTSRILLDTHIRLNCVKVRSPSNKRLSLKIRNSFMNSPAKRMSFAKPKSNILNQTNGKLNLTQIDKPAKGDTTLFNLECEICKMPFSTYRNLFTHKVQKHGYSTPDKSIMAKQKKNSLYKAKAAHGGIPTNDRMKKAYEALRKKLAETTTVDMEMSSVCSS